MKSLSLHSVTVTRVCSVHSPTLFVWSVCARYIGPNSARETSQIADSYPDAAMLAVSLPTEIAL